MGVVDEGREKEANELFQASWYDRRPDTAYEEYVSISALQMCEIAKAIS